MTCNTPNVELQTSIPYFQKGMLFLFPNIVYFIHFVDVLDIHSTIHYRVSIKADSSRVACHADKNLCEGTDSSWG